MVYANLEGNIYPEIFNEEASRILNWIRENPNTDPNAYVGYNQKMHWRQE